LDACRGRCDEWVAARRRTAPAGHKGAFGPLTGFLLEAFLHEFEVVLGDLPRGIYDEQLDDEVVWGFVESTQQCLGLLFHSLVGEGFTVILERSFELLGQVVRWSVHGVLRRLGSVVGIMSVSPVAM